MSIALQSGGRSVNGNQAQMNRATRNIFWRLIVV